MAQFLRTKKCNVSSTYFWGNVEKLTLSEKLVL